MPSGSTIEVPVSAARHASMAAAGLAVAANLWWAANDFAGFREVVAQSRVPAFAAAVRIASALSATSAAALALFLAIRGRRIATALRLADALAWMSLAATYFVLASLALPLRAALRDDARLELALDLFFVTLLAVGSHRFITFWTVYPRAVTAEQVAVDSTRMAHEELKTFRLRILPGALLRWLDRLEAKQTGALALRFRTVSWRFMTGPGGAWAIVAAALASTVLGDIASRAELPETAKSLHFARVPFLALWTALVTAVPVLAITTSRATATPQQREQLRWIWAALWIGGAIYLVPFTVVCLPIFVVLTFAPEWLDAYGIGPWLDGGMLASSTGLLCVPMLFIAGLAMAILYSGSLDPRLAVGRVTLWGMLALLLAALFILVERAVVFWLARAFDLHPSTGALVAGACVAASFQPLRRRAEGWTRDLLARWMPAAALTGGERVEGAVLVTDISGYTALSARAETDARLAAAVLQKAAHEAAARFDGVFVKSLGDGMLLRFAIAADAAAAAGTIEQSFRAATAAVGLRDVHLHSGIHWGEFHVAPDGDVYGQTVNITSRIADRASAGETVVSTAFAQRIADAAARLVPLGIQQFKNIPDPVECLRLAPQGDAP